jgi:uncharacterized protein
MPLSEILLTLISGGIIGIVLGVIGGGGSILAVPLLIYMAGLSSAHEAIGTASVAVAANALASLAGHARAGRVKWPCATVFAALGMVGAAIGAELGKAFDGKRLLALFGLLMIGVGLNMLRRRRRAEAPDVRLTVETAPELLPRLVPIATGTGLAAGFFGIGGGFLIVPGLIRATAMPLSFAVGTSLVVVSALALTTATSYALSGFVEWGVAALMITGGAAGTVAGLILARYLAGQRGLLEKIFAGVVLLAGGYILLRGI